MAYVQQGYGKESYGNEQNGGRSTALETEPSDHENQECDRGGRGFDGDVEGQIECEIVRQVRWNEAHEQQQPRQDDRYLKACWAVAGAVAVVIGHWIPWDDAVLADDGTRLPEPDRASL